VPPCWSDNRLFVFCNRGLAVRPAKQRIHTISEWVRGHSSRGRVGDKERHAARGLCASVFLNFQNGRSQSRSANLYFVKFIIVKRWTRIESKNPTSSPVEKVTAPATVQQNDLPAKSIEPV
jgi:hypothetical protein